MIRVTFLGTAASRPTVGRNVSSLMIQREGDDWMFDCGEGTQRQMMRFGTGFAVKGIFITHMHADHFLGVIGLLRTMALQGRTERLLLRGPPGASGLLRSSVYLGQGPLPFPLEIREMAPGERLQFEEYDIEVVPVDHGTRAVGYALREHPRPGRFDVDRARALGVPEGPAFGRLHSGEVVEGADGPVHPEQVVGPERPGRLVVYTGDTRPSDDVVARAHGADLLVHDATFGSEDRDRARETFHSTATEAAEVALQAGVERLVLTHLSSRYSANPSPLEREARAIFPEAMIAWDGLEIEIEYPPDDREDP